MGYNHQNQFNPPDHYLGSIFFCYRANRIRLSIMASYKIYGFLFAPCLNSVNALKCMALGNITVDTFLQLFTLLYKENVLFHCNLCKCNQKANKDRTHVPPQSFKVSPKAKTLVIRKYAKSRWPPRRHERHMCSVFICFLIALVLHPHPE